MIQLNYSVIVTIAKRTLRHLVETPVAYIVAIFFYGFIGGIFGLNFLDNKQASITGVGAVAPWVLWFVVPFLTMGLISEEIRSGTFEQLTTLPVRDWEVVLGKYLGFAVLAGLLILGLVFYPLFISTLTPHANGIDWGASIGILGGLYLLCLLYGAMGLWASSIARNQVVVLVLGMILTTFFFFMGQFYNLFPGVLAQILDFLGVSSHLNTLNRGVWDVRDLFYFGSLIFIFLYLTALRLSTRRL